MKLDEQLKGRFTEEEVRHIYNKIQEYGVIRAEGVVKMFEEKCWIKKTEMKKEWPKVAKEIFALYEKEIKRLKG